MESSVSLQDRFALVLDLRVPQLLGLRARKE
jgi:hypothetical protein